MKKELLSPAGNMLALKMAVLNGADAVYLGGKNFGARMFAANFTLDELKEATTYCHLYGVKIYITVNTIIYESELKNCLEYINYLYNIGVNAIIVQDLGLISLIRKYFPNLEIHVSTQAHTHNFEQIKFLETLGVKRVVLARELSLEEINHFSPSLELEIFIHGALCICYSGQCLLSSQVLSRSGNRGECAGLCRLSYSLKDQNNLLIKDKYLISPKEFATFDFFSAIKKSPIKSLKIEGRMKSPEYVGYVTKIYRSLLDKPNYHLTHEEIFNLKSLYNRSFTKGYLFNEPDYNLINLNSSNHQGVLIGSVISFNSKYITIKLNHELNQEDAIRLPNNAGMYVNYLYDKNKKLINKGSKNDIVLIDNKVKLNTLGNVYLTINKKLIADLNLNLERKIPLTAYIYAHINKELIIKYNDGKNISIKKGPIVELAKNSPVSKKRLQESLAKLGNTPFILQDITFDIDDNIFIPMTIINDMRRTLIDDIILKRTMLKNKPLNISLEPIISKRKPLNNFKIAVKVRNEEQLKTVLSLDIDYIYVTDYKLYQKYKASNIYLCLNRVMKNHPKYQDENLLIGETGSLKYSQTNHVRSDYFLNIVNSASINLLNKYQVESITLSPELKDYELASLMSNINNIPVELIIYGRLELMIMKYDLFKVHNLNKSKTYYLEDQAKRNYPLINNQETILMSSTKINLINNLSKYQKLGINTFRIELFDEDNQTIKKLINELKNDELITILKSSI